MEVNKEEALRALAIAQRHRNEGNYTSARRFAEKSIKLFSTTEAEKLIAAIDREENASTSSTPNAQTGSSTASGIGKNASAGSTRQRHTNGESSNADKKPREYTTENEKVVKRVQACKVTDYYGILSLKRDCEENDVKKAYRKVCRCSQCIYCIPS
jgi:DnaJ family protein B protein 12